MEQINQNRITSHIDKLCDELQLQIDICNKLLEEWKLKEVIEN